MSILEKLPDGNPARKASCLARQELSWGGRWELQVEAEETFSANPKWKSLESST